MIRMYTAALIVLTISTAIHANPSESLLALAKEITSKRCSHVAEKQYQLLALLKETHDADLRNALLCDSLIDALQKDDTFPTLTTEHRTTIDTAIRLLHDTPGFLPILRHILVTVDSLADAKGPLYLLERALDFTSHGTIHALSTEKKVILPVEMTQITDTIPALAQNDQDSAPMLRGVVDIVTDHVWVKCKNISWKKMPLHAKHLARVTELKDQFLTLKLLADAHNEQHPDNAITLVVSSKTAVPAQWQAWLDAHQIYYWQATSASNQAH